MNLSQINFFQVLCIAIPLALVGSFIGYIVWHNLNRAKDCSPAKRDHLKPGPAVPPVVVQDFSFLEDDEDDDNSVFMMGL